MRWKITIEGMDEFGGRDIAEVVIEKEFKRLSKGEIGLSISDGKTIMACLQQLVVKQQCEAYVLTSRYCSDCETFRRIKDSGKRKIRTVFGRVEVSNPRIMNCRRCLPYFFDASAVLRDICPDQATPELMELGSCLDGAPCQGSLCGSANISGAVMSTACLCGRDRPLALMVDPPGSLPQSSQRVRIDADP